MRELLMINSILTSIKKALGIEEEYIHFDPDIIMHINSAFFTLNQLGVGPDEPFMIEDKSSEWSDFIYTGRIEMVKTYIYMVVRRAFDPPSNSAYLNSLNEMIKEYEWRMNVQVDPDNGE